MTSAEDDVVNVCEKEEEDVKNVPTPWYKYITVEPPMFLYMMAYMITNVIEQTFYVFRACTHDHGYSEDVCHNISSYPDISAEVQVTVSKFHQWNGIAGHVPPMFLAFFLGSYSDRCGRKVVLLAGLLGKLYFSVVITAITALDVPLRWVVWAGTLPSAATGADLAVFASCFAYVADVSPPAARTLRVAALDVAYLSTMPAGVAIGNALYSGWLYRSFTGMFLVNCTLMLLAVLYTALFLRWRTRPEHGPLALDVLDPAHLRHTLRALVRVRTNRARPIFWLLLAAMAFYTFQRDERGVLYLYTSAQWGWGAVEFGHFRTALSAAYVLAMLVGVPLLARVLRLRDTIIVMLGASCHMAAQAVYAQARSGRGMYAGVAAAALGPTVAPLLRSMTSKLLPVADRGVAYALLAVTENAVGLVAAVGYAQLYLRALPASIFYLTLATQAVVFLAAAAMDVLLRGRRLEDVMKHDE